MIPVDTAADGMDDDGVPFGAIAAVDGTSSKCRAVNTLVANGDVMGDPCGDAGAVALFINAAAAAIIDGDASAVVNVSTNCFMVGRDSGASRRQLASIARSSAGVSFGGCSVSDPVTMRVDRCIAEVTSPYGMSLP